jgi:5-methylthioribose kinase
MASNQFLREMNVELLTEDSVLPYLISRGIFLQGEAVNIEILMGGVSNIVMALKSERKDIVIKQALAELKVATKWVADQRRAIIEAHAIEVFHSLSPSQVPALVDFDPELFTLVIERVPHTSTVWKTDLLEGKINPEIGVQLGLTLAAWHNFGALNPSLREKFSEDSLFDQLRISPFYKTVALKNPNLERQISALVEELISNKTTLVHGDFSPKNIMINHNRDIYILDFEVVHNGNPVFDLAFLTAHLLCKFVRAQTRTEEDSLRETAQRFLEAYGSTHTTPAAASLTWHTALIALARVEGTSTVNYLDQGAQELLMSITKGALMLGTPPQMMELFSKN